MKGTIVQQYGPIYGEPVNGTVFGRPNGSVYVPPTNTIDLSVADNARYFTRPNPTTVRLCNSSGSPHPVLYTAALTAVAQDLSSNIQLQLYEDAECTALIAKKDLTAGLFNTTERDVILVDSDYVFEPAQECYLRAQLMNNGVPVATSGVIPIINSVVE